MKASMLTIIIGFSEVKKVMMIQVQWSLSLSPDETGRSRQSNQATLSLGHDSIIECTSSIPTIYRHQLPNNDDNNLYITR